MRKSDNSNGHLELRLKTEHYTEVIYIRKDCIALLRSKPNEFSEDENDLKVMIKTIDTELIVTLAKKDAAALYKFFSDDNQDTLKIEGIASSLY